ncbi:MAG: hypothetical protein CME65_03360 [Halobacteriovoraceae bacterium]|nr:hypothetical protein [Halobacteriovoraceae bacterium]
MYKVRNYSQKRKSNSFDTETIENTCSNPKRLDKTSYTDGEVELATKAIKLLQKWETRNEKESDNNLSNLRH